MGESEPTAPRPETERPRVLRRSREDRVIADACAGLGRYFVFNPVLKRIAFVVLAIAGGGGILLANGAVLTKNGEEWVAERLAGVQGAGTNNVAANNGSHVAAGSDTTTPVKGG